MAIRAKNCTNFYRIETFSVNYPYKNKRGGDVSIKEKREKEKESQEIRKEKIAKKRLKRNGSIEGRSSSELESSVGFLGKVKNGEQK